MRSVQSVATVVINAQLVHLYISASNAERVPDIQPACPIAAIWSGRAGRVGHRHWRRADFVRFRAFPAGIHRRDFKEIRTAVGQVRNSGTTQIGAIIVGERFTTAARPVINVVARRPGDGLPRQRHLPVAEDHAQACGSGWLRTRIP